ncbi:MAG: BrnT family toxin [Xanthomonadales bacterium]|nr:BrnT family toxin [Xanthomonadales bacterium]
MKNLRFEWDDAKNKANIQKHGVSFDEAKSVFADDYGLLIADPDHSENEDRFVLLGFSGKLRLLLVCHCFEISERLVRIISCRKAKGKETLNYRR